MSEITDTLNLIWSQFRREGITDDLVIIEHIAALLTEDLKFPNENLRPRKVPIANDIVHIRDHLKKASSLAGDDAKLFDRHVIMRLSSMLPGGRYPTPRHIADFMYQIARVEKSGKLGDLACGSGGLLVRPDWPDLTDLIGTEISVEWARIAYANCLLHGFHNARIEIGNALTIFSKNGKLYGETFDRILMNPPFGEKFDVKLAKDILGPEVSSRSETVLSLLAISKLIKNGRAAILSPSGLLFSGSKAEKSLRHLLIKDYQLEAVVSFPKDALQPFSPIQTHLILAQKASPNKDTTTWFFRAEKDGYPTGRSRDLTDEPELHSDFPLIRMALGASRREWDARFPEGDPLIGFKFLKNQKNEPAGFILGAISERNISLVEVFTDVAETPLTFVGVKKDEASNEIWIKIDSALDTTEVIYSYEEYKEYLRKITGIKKVEGLSRKRFILNPVSTREILFDRNNSCLGIVMLQSMVKAPEFDLRPESYVKALEPERAQEPPAAILAEIRRNQKAFLKRIDGLLGLLDMPPIAQAKIPSKVLRVGVEFPKPFGCLSKEQQKVWEEICEKTQSWNGDGEEYPTPVYFSACDLGLVKGEEESQEIQSALELFEKMGLIVEVTIGSHEGKERVRCYRLTAERDRWKVVGEKKIVESSEGSS